MISRTLRNGLVAAIAAVAVFPVAAVADSGPAAHAPGWTITAPQTSSPSWYPTAPQPSVPGRPGAQGPKHTQHTHPKAPKRHSRYRAATLPRHHLRHHLATRVWGRVATHHRRLHVRSGPGTGYRIIGSRPSGRMVVVSCKRRGSNVMGNQRWYKLAHHKGYVSAHYVRTRSAVRWC